MKQRIVSECCLNCGREIAGENYCPACGQENDQRIVPAGHLLRDVLDEFLKYDAKLLNTLSCLILKPGYLTVEYVAGRRAKYITPLKLYFIVSAFFFFSYSLCGMSTAVRNAGGGSRFLPGKVKSARPGAGTGIVAYVAITMPASVVMVTYPIAANR